MSLKPSIFEILKQFELLNKLQGTMTFAFYNYRHFLDNFVQECIFGSRNLIWLMKRISNLRFYPRKSQKVIYLKILEFLGDIGFILNDF